MESVDDGVLALQRELVDDAARRTFVQAATNQRRNINVEVSGPVKLGAAASHAPTMNLSGQYNRQELFSGTQSSLQAGAPRVSVRVNSNLRRLFYYDVNAEGAYLQSRPFAPVDAPAAQTNVRRFDTTTRLRAPLRMPSWFSLTPSAAWRFTQYFDSRDPATGVVGPEPLTRNVFDLKADMTGPILERIFHTPDNRFAQSFQHIITTAATVDWLSPFDKATASRIFIIDQVDQIPTGTTRVAYSLTMCRECASSRWIRRHGSR